MCKSIVRVAEPWWRAWKGGDKLESGKATNTHVHFDCKLRIEKIIYNACILLSVIRIDPPAYFKCGIKIEHARGECGRRDEEHESERLKGHEREGSLRTGDLSRREAS